MIVVQELDMALGDTIRCQFGEELADGEVVDANTARCWAPPGTAGETVVVRLQHGSDGMYTRGAGAFEYISAPIVRIVEPSIGPEAGGRIVSVYGSGFKSGGATCRFGSRIAPASGAVGLSSSLLTCMAPASTEGAVAVEVSMNGGSDFTRSGVQYMYVQGVKMTELRPSEGRADKIGETVTAVSYTHLTLPTILLV